MMWCRGVVLVFREHLNSTTSLSQEWAWKRTVGLPGLEMFGGLNIKVYWKSTHTDQHLLLDFPAPFGTQAVSCQLSELYIPRMKMFPQGKRGRLRNTTHQDSIKNFVDTPTGCISSPLSALGTTAWQHRKWTGTNITASLFQIWHWYQKNSEEFSLSILS